VSHTNLFTAPAQGAKTERFHATDVILLYSGITVKYYGQKFGELDNGGYPILYVRLTVFGANAEQMTLTNNFFGFSMFISYAKVRNFYNSFYVKIADI